MYVFTFCSINLHTDWHQDNYLSEDCCFVGFQILQVVGYHLRNSKDRGRRHMLEQKAASTTLLF